MDFTEFTETDNPIEYDWYLTGPQGARFTLYPQKGKHTPEDIQAAKRWLYRNQDVVKIYIEWKAPDDDQPMPIKLTDEMIIKNLNREIGEKDSYIQELEDRLSKEKLEHDKQIRKEVKADDMYMSLKKQLAAAKKEIVSLRVQISDLVTRLNKKES